MVFWLVLPVAGGRFHSLDLNHRPALGTLELLWSQVAPHLADIKVLVLATTCMAGVARLVGIATEVGRRTQAGCATGERRRGGYVAFSFLLSLSPQVNPDVAGDDPRWITLMQDIHSKVGGPMVACCFKTRDAAYECAS